MDTSKLLNWIIMYCLGMMLCLRESFSQDYTSEYLKKYGYLEPSDGRSGNLTSEDNFKQALSEFQKFAGLPMTGSVDEETERMISTRRCGMADRNRLGDRARRKRYALYGSGWQKRDIFYSISQYSRKVPIEDVQKELQRAFDLWSDVIPLHFIRHDYGPVDIDIQFVTGNHGDNTPFDGNGQTLAHAYFPEHGGYAHFDDDEHWTVNISDGVNLYQVAAHEFGHSLGLAHSDVRSAVMAPFYGGYSKYVKLDTDDILVVQELYGPKSKDDSTTNEPSTLKSPAPFINIPNICKNATIDAITRTDNGITYMFKGEYYYRLNEEGIDTGYPRVISWDWGSVEGPIDAALTWPNGSTFIFKGSQYWKFHNLQLIYGPKNISEGFDGIPSVIDASFVWSGNQKTYFIKGDKYWRYHGNRIDYRHPRDLNSWRGLPEQINAAFQWKNGKTYFFSRDQYYRYNDSTFNIDTGSYPRDIATWWLGCPDKSQITAIDRPTAMLDNSNGNTDEQWITADVPFRNSAFTAKGDFHDDLHSGTVIHTSSETTLIALYILQTPWFAMFMFRWVI